MPRNLINKLKTNAVKTGCLALAIACLSAPVWAQSETDITGALLSAQDADCSAYIGTYVSHITDTTTGQELTGAVTITASASECTLQTNQIPNHDTGEGSHFR